MSVVQPSALPDRGVSPLMSNNPFRNRIASQISPEQTSPRPLSTNPFLDSTEVNGMGLETANKAVTLPVTENNSLNKTANAFSSLEINDAENDLQKTRSRQSNAGPRRLDPPPSRGFPRASGHRPAASEEEKRRQPPAARAGELDIFADPYEPPQTRDRARQPRRNSESSVRDKPSMDPEEERRRRERKHRETRRTGSKSGKPNKKLDIIDKLDVTSIYGTGLFHHDGPFDACNPHRNRKKEKYAPIQAFPKDSVNMVMGGSGPVNKRMDYDKFHGHGQEAHGDYNEAAIAEEPMVEPYRPDPKAGFDPNAREAIHGQETVGLGTSTFLEGAPASRVAMQRRESEYETPLLEERPGLSRKKSLAQKIRGVRPNRDRFASPEDRNGPYSPPVTGSSETGVNPFFRDQDGQMRKDGATIAFDEQPRPTRPRAPSSPKRNELERQNTVESVGGDAQSKPTGLLGRMKSLKGGRRPARRDTNS